MKRLTFSLLLIPLVILAGPQWQDSVLVKVESVNGWCEHCGGDVVKMNYSFKTEDGLVYTAQIGLRAIKGHPLDVTLNGHIRLRFEKDGHIGDYIHILDDSGKDKKLRIVSKAAPTPAS